MTHINDPNPSNVTDNGRYETDTAQTALLVKQFASRERADMPGYYQWFEAHKDDKFCGAVYDHVPDCGIVMNERHLVQERYVRTNSGTSWEAVRLFKEWLHTGKPEAFLMEPR